MRVLCVGDSLPCPVDSGYAWRCLGLLRALCDAHDVTLLATLRREPSEEDLEKTREVLGRGRMELFRAASFGDRGLRSRSSRWARAATWRVPAWVVSHYEPALANTLIAEAAGHDVVVFLDNSACVYWKSLPTGTCSVVDVHNVSASFLAAVDHTGAPLRDRIRAGVELRLMREYERQYLAAVTAVTVTSAEEAERMRQLYGREPDAVVPSSVDAPAQPHRRIGARKIGWLGALEYAPNREGLIRFVEGAWHQLADADCELLVAGPGAVESVRHLSRYRGVESLGFVSSLESFFDQLGAAVVPLWHGAGVKLKTVDFLAAGVPVVATPVAVEGLNVVDERDALIAGDPLGLASRLLALLSNAGKATSLGDAGRRLVLDDYSWESVGRTFVSAVERAVGGTRSHDRASVA